MFLKKTLQRNPELIRYSIELHQSGLIMPDTYVIDLDAVVSNAQEMLAEAGRYDIQLFFMTKQFGRNPIVSKELVRLGYEGAVAVDFKEAQTLMENGIPIANVGHLVQIPSRLVERIVKIKPQFITVYSVDKAREIDEACKMIGVKQNLLLRVMDRDDVVYDGQFGGFQMEGLEENVKELRKLNHVAIAGVTAFPCFLYDSEKNDIWPTNNIQTLNRATRLLRDKFGIEIKHLNMPSVTCTHSIRKIYENGGTQGEPGHGLLGSTPMHAETDLIERPAMLYVSEISHRLGESSYCYGGGFYHRSQIDHALIAGSAGEHQFAKVDPPRLDSIDYHFELAGKYPVGHSVIMAFRTQVFVTRSDVAVVKGLSNGNPKLLGIFDSSGKWLKESV